MNARDRGTGLYRQMGYLAIWPALYACGVLVLAWALLGNGLPDADSALYILLCAHGCYLLDRVKVSDRRQDPADALALPNRTMLFARWAKPIRVLVMIELFFASFAGWLIHPALAGVPLIALGVVHLYAGRGASPSDPRLKDLPGIKAFVIAGGHVALSLAIIFANEHALIAELNLLDILAIFGLWLIVSGDAALCDIDDHDADRAYHTQSLSVLFGKRTAWWASLGLIALGASLVGIQYGAMLGIGATLVLSTLLSVKNTNHRDFVDARLLPIVLFWVLVSTR